eukprot:340105-Pelagomonas_calceolata.AAC.1
MLFVITRGACGQERPAPCALEPSAFIPTNSISTGFTRQAGRFGLKACMSPPQNPCSRCH